MEPPPLGRYSPHSSKKRVFTGSGSGDGSLWMDEDVVEIPPPLAFSKSKSAKQKQKQKQRQITVIRFMSQRQRIAANAENFTNLYVKNLDDNLTDDDLREKFSEFGTVCNAVIMRDGEGKPKGFGFISYESPEEAKKAVEALNGSEFGSKKLFVGRAQKKAEREEVLKCENENIKILKEKARAANVYVKHLDPSVDDTISANHFSSCGRIISAMFNKLIALNA